LCILIFEILGKTKDSELNSSKHSMILISWWNNCPWKKLDWKFLLIEVMFKSFLCHIIHYQISTITWLSYALIFHLHLLYI
jgi:hypothetical protein